MTKGTTWFDKNPREKEDTKDPDRDVINQTKRRAIIRLDLGTCRQRSAYDVIVKQGPCWITPHKLIFMVDLNGGKVTANCDEIDSFLGL